MTKHSKSGEKLVNVHELLHDVSVCAKEGEIRMSVTLVAGEGKTITPEALIVILRERLGLFTGDPLKERYRIVRRDVLLADARTSFR